MENAENTPATSAIHAKIKSAKKKAGKKLFNGKGLRRGERYTASQKHNILSIMKPKAKVVDGDVKVERGLYTRILAEKKVTFLTARKWLREAFKIEV